MRLRRGAGVLILAALINLGSALSGCGPRRTAGESPGVPLSDELRPALEASRRSLREGDRGDPRVKADLVRYDGLQEMLYRRDHREAAEDSLLALWRRDLTNYLWPDLAAFNSNLLRRKSSFLALYSLPGFPDTTTALGVFLREWSQLNPESNGRLFRAAWRRRDELSPPSRIGLALKIARQDRFEGRNEDAVRLTLSTLPGARELAGWRGELECWGQAARALCAGEHLDDALHAATLVEEISRSISRQTGNRAIVLRALLLRGEVLSARREAQAALGLYEGCADSAVAEGLHPFAGEALNRAGILTASTGEYARGLGYYRRSLAVAMADHDSLTVPRELANLARRHLLMGDPDSCRILLDEAGRWIRAYPDVRNRHRFPLFQAEYHAAVGDYRSVDSLLAAAMGLQNIAATIDARAELKLQLIRQQMELGQPARAYRTIAALDSMRGRFGRSFADRNEVFDLDLAEAEFLGRQGLFSRAQRTLDQADSVLQRQPDPNRAWELQRARGSLARRRGDASSAEAAFRSCLELSRRRQNQAQVAESRLLLATQLLESGNPAAVRELVDADPDSAFGGRFRTRLSMLLLLASAEARAGQYGEALTILGRARAGLRPETPSDLGARLELEIGRAEAGLGRREKARAAYARAAQQLAIGTEGAPSETELALERDLRRELAEAVLDLALGAGAKAVRGRDAESALAEAVHLIPDWCRNGRVPSPAARPQLLYFVGESATYRWTLTESAACLERLSGETEILDALNPVLADLARSGRSVNRAELGALTARLGGQPEGWREAERLIIVPDGPLYAVPWPVLAGEGNTSWLDRGPILLVDAPGVPVESGRIGEGDQETLLALGVNGSPQVREAGLRELRHAEEEARAVAGLWPEGQVTLRLGREGDWRSLGARALAQFDVIHLASHAIAYQGASGGTTLLLAGSGDRPVTSGEIGRLDLGAKLVYLSCCEAAEGVRRGLGPAHAGLARSFLAAGADRVIAPSLRIDDESARHLADRFYGYWRSGLSAEAALRRAQLDLRDGDPRWAHPGSWACYQAIAAEETSPGRSR